MTRVWNKVTVQSSSYQKINEKVGIPKINILYHEAKKKTFLFLGQRSSQWNYVRTTHTCPWGRCPGRRTCTVDAPNTLLLSRKLMNQSHGADANGMFSHIDRCLGSEAARPWAHVWNDFSSLLWARGKKSPAFIKSEPWICVQGGWKNLIYFVYLLFCFVFGFLLILINKNFFVNWFFFF